MDFVEVCLQVGLTEFFVLRFVEVLQQAVLNFVEVCLQLVGLTAVLLLQLDFADSSTQPDLFEV